MTSLCKPTIQLPGNTRLSRVDRLLTHEIFNPCVSAVYCNMLLFSLTFVLFPLYYTSTPTYTALSHIPVAYLPTLWSAYLLDTDWNQIFNNSLLLELKNSLEHQKLWKSFVVWKIAAVVDSLSEQRAVAASHTLCKTSYFSSGPFFSRHNIVVRFVLAWAVHVQAFSQYLKLLTSHKCVLLYFLHVACCFTSFRFRLEKFSGSI